MKIKTDRESQAMVASAVLTLPENELVDWKSDNGWVILDKTTINSIANYMRLHVQNCFKKEKELHDSIDNVTNFIELDAIDIESGWPPND